ncbi:MAG TPA: sialate O-acetylesterase [Roseiarcus sp.]|nr:sialate O-acetylesterase [Roseiarcus sp.]
MFYASRKVIANSDRGAPLGTAKHWKRSLALLSCFTVTAFLFGGLTSHYKIFPWPVISRVKETVFPKAPPASRYTFDSLGRLMADESKTQVKCPAQTRRTAVLLVLGQSNAANYAGQRFRSRYGGDIVNFLNGDCFIAQSPLLGSSGTKGEYWTQLANLLKDSNQVDQVVLAPLAFSGTPVSRWARGGDMNVLLVDVLTQLKSSGYKVTRVLWDQGEADYVEGTSEEVYRQQLTSMIDTLRQHGVDANVFVSIASKCLEPSNGAFKTFSPDNAIVRAQRQMQDDRDDVRRGVNTDTLVDDLDRYDDCHLGDTGANKVAQAWAKLLLSDPSVQAGNR